MGTVTAHEATNRVQVAAHHWRPRFIANGIDVNDFDETVKNTTDWRARGAERKAVGEGHEGLGWGAEQRGRTVSATPVCQRGGRCHLLWNFLWFVDDRARAH